MRVQSKKYDMAECDLTPMIDMVFQLIAFFMVLINFGQTESNDRVVLPKRVLVKPPEEVLKFPIMLHVASDGEVIMGGETFTVDTLRLGLNREISVIRSLGKEPSEANVIIRAHRDTPAGDVQEVIRVAQEQQLERFALRVKEDRQ
jgi:biopolymer transport protein ExbD